MGFDFENDSAEAVLRDAIAADVADPRDDAHTGNHLWCVYNDGELTSQKAGRLWMTRNEHLMDPGDPDPPRPLLALPRMAGDPAFAYVVLADGDAAQLLRARIVCLFRRARS